MSFYMTALWTFADMDIQRGQAGMEISVFNPLSHSQHTHKHLYSLTTCKCCFLKHAHYFLGLVFVSGQTTNLSDNTLD